MEAAKTWLYLLYWVAIAIGGYFFFDENFFIGSLMRAALMPILAVYLYVSLKPTHSITLKFYFFAAILVLWISDIFRIYITPDITDTSSKDPALVTSLYINAVSGLFYSLAYYKVRKLKWNKATFASIAFIVGVVLIYFLFFKFISKGIIKDFKTPFVVQMVSLILPLSLAANIGDSNSRKKLATNYFLPACVLAILSAALFAFNKYKLFQPKLDAAVLLFYGYAQIININGFRKTSK